MVMEGGDKKFYVGQHRSKTYSAVAKMVEFIEWLMAQSDLSMQNQDFLTDFLTWFNRYYTIQDGSVHVRSSLGLPEKAYVPRPKKTGMRKTPPNPPLAQKGALCKDFTHAGSTMSFIRSTCGDCGRVEQKPREVTYTHDPSTCRHEVVDCRGSSRSVSRTFCKQRGKFMDEVSGEFHAQRRAAAARVLDATSNALDVIDAMTNKGAATDYSPEAVAAILSAFNDRALQADDIILHGYFREAIAKTIEDPDSPWSEVTTRGTSPTPVTMVVFAPTGMPYSKAKAEMYGKGPRAVIWPPGHPEAPDAQASQSSQPSGRGKGTGTDPETRFSLLIALGSFCKPTS